MHLRDDVGRRLGQELASGGVRSFEQRQLGLRRGAVQ